ncbi:MAG TPA: heparinase II/III family protein [Flavisolibacter sp.]|nr:heparinase II/III family protein [Flavisolibacter sp.]
MRMLTVYLLCLSVLAHAQHPVAFATKADLLQLKGQLNRYPALTASYTDTKKMVDAWLGKEVDVPFPKDPAGGYTHERHKENYILMLNGGLLYNLTGDRRYALLVRDMLLKYAALNPGLGKHPQATSSSPGRIFWQALNDANWLVYAGLGYDLIQPMLTPAERKTIEQGAFKPEVDFITKDLESWFNLIHNHGVWACAGVGIVGIATDNADYVRMALHGTDGKSGYMVQLDELFSPDGYYTEGPYYVRYALLPFYLFANALNNARPELKIFEHRGRILRKALDAGLQQTNTDGRFFPVNDAIKEKDYTTNELVTAVNIAWDVYGKDEALLAIAARQGRVMLHTGGAGVAAALAAGKGAMAAYPYKTVEYGDGPKGNQGGISLLRSGTGSNLTSLFFKYASHGLSHGHYDRLGIFLYDQGNEVLADYGAVRFIGVEQKWGGRYLPENKTYAAQTIAHNTITVDETSHFKGKEADAEKNPGQKIFSDVKDPRIQVVAAKEEKAYDDVRLYRTVYFLQLPGASKPLLVDLFRTVSDNVHQYDLPFQYNGQLISTSFAYQSHTAQQQTLGKRNGYQFLWKEAEAILKDTMAQLTFLTGKTYYSVSTLTGDSAHIFFTRAGANDPNFNLRRVPSYIIRKRGTSKQFVSVVEIHGNYDPVGEFSGNAYSSVQDISLLREDGDYTIARIRIKGKELIVAQANKEYGAALRHSISAGGKPVEWTGPFGIWYEGKPLKN